MPRPPARRARRLAARALSAALATGLGPASCGDGAPPVPVVEVAAQRCDRPTRARGLGVVVGPDRVATAAHTVEGDLRDLTVDGRPAAVVAVDARTDLALLDTDVDQRPVAWPGTSTGGGAAPGAAVVHLADGRLDVEIVRTGALVVHDVTDRVRHRRDVVTFTPGVGAGVSGAPLTTPAGELLGIVVLDRRDTDEAHAVSAAELRALLDATGGTAPPARPRCPD